MGKKKKEDAERTLLSRVPMPVVNPRSVVVIRVIADDSTTNLNAEQLRDVFFYDDINLSTQIDDCSYGYTTIQPYHGPTTLHHGTPGNNIERGLVEITMNESITGSNSNDVANTVINLFEQQYGNYYDQFDHLILCLVRKINRKQKRKQKQKQNFFYFYKIKRMSTNDIFFF